MSVLALEVSSRLGELELSVALDAGPAPLAIAGPSGAGKTSLLRMLAGLMRPLSGWIRCGAVTWFDGAARVDVPPEARRCGLVFQDYALFPHLRAWENVAFGAGGGRRARRRRAFDMLERFGMGQRALARPGELSGGERQRVALARALAREPRLLLLDEPLAALDPGTRLRSGRELGAIVADAGIPVVLVTHDFAEAASLAEDIAVLERGAIVQRGSPRELAARPGSAFVADLTGASVLAGVAADGPDGLAVVSLEGGATIVSAEELRGHVAASVHPWEVALEPASTASVWRRSRVRTESWRSPRASCTSSIAAAKAVASVPNTGATDSPTRLFAPGSGPSGQARRLIFAPAGHVAISGDILVSAA